MPLRFESPERSPPRRPTWVRQTPSSSLIPSADYTSQHSYHRALDGYEPTALISLDALAAELGLDGIYIKDESSRFGLPSFKASGASWGCFRALISQLSLDLATATLEQVASAAQDRGCRLLAATDGNHGRAIAWMARSFGIESSIYVPHDLHPNFLRLIAAEGAEVVVVQGDYDFAVSTATSAAASSKNNILVQDTAFEGYEDIPTWIIDGYATIFTEMEEQLRELNVQPDTIITPVGVGSLAQAVITFAKGQRDLKTVAVEPETAACLHTSLVAGKATSIVTSNTINAGCNCGTLSSISWPYLRDYVDLSTTVSDFETHIAVQELHRHNVNAGPCGASGLAALKRLVAEGHVAKGSSVILINTEAKRPYDIPLDVSTNDVVALTQQLVQIDSSNPSLDTTNTAPGEAKVAAFITQWLHYRGIETHAVESIPGRPSVVGVVRGNDPNAKSLMLNGHIDTVSLSTYGSDPLGGSLIDGKIYGRGVLDMKAGVAAAMTTLLHFSVHGSKGDVIFAAVADEEDKSIGTAAVLAAGWKADAALIPEPTSLQLFHAHKGFVWIEVTILGNAAHGSDAETGVDAIMSTATFMKAIEEYAETLDSDNVLGQATMHCGTIRGGEENSSYAASCTLTLELRTVNNDSTSQSSAAIVKDVTNILKKLAVADKKFRFEVPKVLFERKPLLPMSVTHPLLVATSKAIADVQGGREVQPTAAKFWTDAALLSEAGIPSLVFGPEGEGLHGKDEWVDVESIKMVELVMRETIERFQES
ncbi:diaminopropionate ammonia-lyase [Aureobasidium sp. EXF-3400]|nr:diaminopropionate ammonia-lyase [Aureobasidium sp. EXF-12344]KAI4783441.1 diaminopropionate ammonia-lyase [Aureobasidium sp. EXF-3400]